MIFIEIVAVSAKILKYALTCEKRNLYLVIFKVDLSQILFGT